MYKYIVPETKKIRLIIDSDAKCEADDQFAIVHALLTPKFDIRGLIGAQFGDLHFADSMERSVAECKKIVGLMQLQDKVPVVHGAKTAVKSETEYEYSEGARLIVEEAMRDDPHPLYITFQGPLTDVACAYLQEPAIADRITVVWIGGGKYPEGGGEFNLSNDILAANIVMQSPIKLWKVPINVYAKMIVSFAELDEKVRPYGEIGGYLFEQLMEFSLNAANHGAEWTQGESWGLGDSPTVGLLLNPQLFNFHEGEAPVINEDMSYHFTGKGRQIRIYDEINARFILEDMFSKLRLTYGDQRS